MSDFIVRFFVGGLSRFSLRLGALRPKSFAGLFSAAPSIALQRWLLPFTGTEKVLLPRKR